MKASDIISVFDAALLWFGKQLDPLPNYGHYEWIIRITRDPKLRNIAQEVLDEIDRGRITAKRKSWLAKIPASWNSTLGALPGGLDPRGTEITIADLVKFAAERNQRPNFIAHLMASPTTHSGGAGRPSSMHLIEMEMKRRAAARELAPTLSQEAQSLSEWIKNQHPQNARPKAKSISNSLRTLYRGLNRPSPK
jgi:hypothetical protein